MLHLLYKTFNYICIILVHRLCSWLIYVCDLVMFSVACYNPGLDPV